MVSTMKWWQRAVFYQIFPCSFADGNGDFPGMPAKLDYLRDLGVDARWLSPHSPSPFLDCGYDIADFRTFLHAAHARGIRLILDRVLNLSSDCRSPMQCGYHQPFWLPASPGARAKQAQPRG
jgi:alpha-glucosidase